MRLSERQVDALKLAEHGQLTPDKAHHATLRSLEKRGLIAWKNRPAGRFAHLTDQGRLVLHPPPRPPQRREERAVFLAPKSGYTSRADSLDAGAVLAPEVVRHFTRLIRLVEEQEREGRIRARQQARAPLDFEARLVAVQRLARRTGMDVTGDVWMIKKLAVEGRVDQALVRLRVLEGRLDRRAAA